ncbi:ALK tyrosine kinase receptor-like [Anneissia japonica]|uniref:ALK tyrosine kinase receptor-like n=1 Tax=Anneissia japonica TaxID=1529436 RepID=UPI0014256AD7|nr:ALK tyrosine kinase receptor-like [Anneissia japonica]
MEKLISCVQICVLFTCINLVVPYNTLHRSYDLNPTTDTFIDDNISENYSKDYLQLYWRSAFDQSRILMRFDIDKFKKLSKWGLLDSTSLSNTTLLSAKLRLTCIAGSLDNVVHASRIVRSWSAEAVTSTTRGEKGELWSMTFVETRGEDATSAIESKTLTVDAKLTAENVVFEIDMKEIFEHWLENTASNHGLLLWLQNTTSSGANDIVKFASTEYALVSFHPVINVVLEDEVFIKGNCTRNDFQCGDGSCIPNDKLCNFINDCLHATDETTCGIDCGFETPCGWVSSTSEGTIGWKIGSIEILNEDFYMYVNGSQEPSGTVSDLSHEFRDSNYRCQLHFNYFMSGRDVDSLGVDIAYNGVQYTVWTKAGGDYRDTWQGDVLNIGKLEGAFEVIFRAGTGGTKTDIIAIDNISLKDCGPDPENITQNCGTSQLTCGNHQCVSPSKVCDFQKDCLFGEDEDSSTCGIMPEGSRCNFEDGLCGWWDIVGEDNFNWTRHHGSTKSSGTGPSADHTLGTQSGFYIYTEASNQDPRAKAYIRSPWFPPPPPEVGDQYSEYYQMCQIRFYHHMFGEHNAELKLFVYHNYTRETVNQLFSEITSNTEVPWTLFKTPLQYTTVSYYLQFEVTRGFRYRGDIALDDISLSRECFTLDHLQQKTTEVPTSIVTVTDAVDRGTTSLHSTEALHQDELTDLEQVATSLSLQLSNSSKPPTRIPIGQTVQATNSTQFKFSTCGAVGRFGPTQNDCDKAYQHSDVFVQLEDSGDEFIAGVQMWIVPVSRLYRITAKGASGGRGIESTQDSYGAVVMATFNLTKGDMLYILVGHKGESACDGAHKLISDHCKELDNVTRQRYGPDGHSAGGGGGGGGASYIAMFNKTSREWYPLLVAGGGGGLGLSDQKLQDGKNAGILDAGLGINGVMNYNASDTSGSGGGWNDSASYRTSGSSFFQGATGGQSCIAAFYDNRWTTSGGFGGGGGPCVSGGGGGGYTGGSASLTKDMKAYGFGGTSYTSSEAMLVYQEIGNHGDGAVQVSATVSCDLLENLSPDFLGCVSPTTPSPPAKSSSIKSAIIVAISIVVVLLLSFILLLIIYFYRRQSKKLKNIEEQIPAVQLAKLRENISVDVNPCYLLGDGTVSASDLKELPRNQIKLVRALGEGAFGEVFEGTYKVNSFESKQIAVKTLPEICTEQNEKDFLLEAMIMNNFNHPNIVKFIGVCFTQHPRFIILELMAGGELKQFLRDNRPVQNQPSKIKMLDLLHIAKDVAQGCCYLESKKFIHRDIAARNILLSTHSADRVAKIGDFGMARDIYGADYYRKSGRALLPVKWMPPEAFLDGIFTAKTDIWSFGVLLWEIMSLGYMPYPGMSNQEVIQFVSTGNRMSPPSKCPPQV